MINYITHMLVGETQEHFCTVKRSHIKNDRVAESSFGKGYNTMFIESNIRRVFLDPSQLVRKIMQSGVKR